MEGLHWLTTVRDDIRFVYDHRYALHNFRYPEQDRPEGGRTWWSRMMDPILALPPSALKDSLLLAFGDLIENRPATVEACRQVLCEMEWNINALRECLQMHHSPHADAHQANMRKLKGIRCDWMTNAHIESGDTPTIERHTYTPLQLHPWTDTQLFLAHNQVDAFGRIAIHKRRVVGHYVCSFSEKMVRLLTWGVKRDKGYAQRGVPEAMAADVLLFLSPRSETSVRHTLLSNGIPFTHDAVH